MEANKEMEMKKHVLGMLKNFMMGEEGSKFKPKAIQVEMMGEPKEVKGKAGLADLLKDASEHAPDMDTEGPMEDKGEDEEAEMPKKMSPKEFFKRK